MSTTSDPLGIDIAATLGLDPTFRLVRGQENLANACIRRLGSEEGCLAEIGGDTEYGYDLRAQLNSESTDPHALGSINARTRNELLKDPRVQDAAPQVIAVAGQGYALPIRLQTAEGPFEFVASVGDMGVDRLKQGLPSGIPAVQGDVVGKTITVVTEIGPPGEAGGTGAPGANAGAAVDPDLDGLYASDSGNEDLLKEVVADFSGLSAGSLSLAFSVLICALNGATATFRLRLGGTDGVADGTLLATVTTSSGSYAVVRATSTLTNPMGQQRVKLTGQTDTIGATVLVKSTIASFAVT
jgi:hypothetical protein